MNVIRKPLMLLTLALVALALLATPAMAQRGRGPGGPGGPGGGMHGLMRALDLTETQRDQVHAVADRYHDEIFEPRREALDAARHALVQAIHDTSGGEAGVREAAQALATLEADMAVQRHAMWTEIEVFLTEEQRAKAQEILAEGPPERPKRRGGRGRNR